MKKVLSLLFIACLVMASCSKGNTGLDDIISEKHDLTADDNPHGGNNTTSVPAAVTSSFNKRYANAAHIEWKQLSDGNFKAEFFRGAVKWQATFTTNGTLVKEEHN